ncbi:hypothetical protein Q5H92_22635 [Hymenobacter sp. M29]|uniref:Gliding motility-associated protein GldM first immunoglobulin-like domain-containing protein n=1 Tax=Hymenobacter mellowenesis TaxID=3063995 RepID=A0ABT9AH32_9BACT|nr:hypothetical protein [Hymenobacter sp. M29]MDO7849178.1 hypothetical protein [Hymenobacter sp. M29]
MKSDALCWGIGIILAVVAGHSYWQHRQSQVVLQLLDAALQVSNERAQTEAEMTIHKMHQLMERNQNQPRDMVLLRETEEIHRRADKAVKTIRAIRRDLQLKQAAKPHQGGPAEARERAGQEVLAYTTYLKQLMTASTEGKMAALQFLVAKHRQAGWPTGYSLPVELALLTQQEATIREYERLALQHQNEKIGCGLNIIFDAFGAFASAEANTVAVGDKYKAELFLASAYGSPVLGMTVNGRPIAVGPDKRGHVEFTVPPPAGPGGKAYWTGRIRALVKGRDSIFTVKVPYTVRAN